MYITPLAEGQTYCESNEHLDKIIGRHMLGSDERRTGSSRSQGTSRKRMGF